MGLLGPKLSIVLERDGPYRWGDTIAGTIVIQSETSHDVHNVDIVLRCTESAAAILLGRFGVGAPLKQQYSDHNRLYSFRQTLFPEHLRFSDYEPPISWSSERLKPRNKWATQFKTNYRLQAGTHRMHFTFVVPHGYPSSLLIDSSNYLRWALTAKIFRGTLLTTSQDFSLVVKVFRSATLYFDPLAINRVEHTERLKIYFDGYQKSTQSFSGFLSNLSQSENTFKRREDIHITMDVPKVGLVQDPSPINVTVGIDSEFLNNVILMSLKVKLARKVVASVYPTRGFVAQQRELHFSSATIYRKTKICQLVKDVLAAVNEELRKTRITGYQTDTSNTRHFQVSYELILEIEFSSIESPRNSKKARLACPVRLQSCMADISRGKVKQLTPVGTLPVYTP